MFHPTWPPKEADGTDSVVFYKAMNRETMRAEFVVGVFAHGDPDGAAVIDDPTYVEWGMLQTTPRKP